MPFQIDLLTNSIAELSTAIRTRQLTCVGLAQACLDQIHKNDKQGLILNAISDLSSTALEEAKALDREIETKGTRGPLHGIPCVIKEEIAVKGCAWTGGSIAFGDKPVDFDGAIVTKLREAGAVVLGITNMTDLATFASCAPGWSSRGGTILCPYNRDFDPSSSSSGPAVAVASGYAPFSIGSQTYGSMVMPGCRNGLAYIKITPGTLPTGGTLAWAEGLAGYGIFAKTANDVAQVWKVLDPTPICAKPNLAPVDPLFNEPVDERTAAKLRIGVPWELFADEMFRYESFPKKNPNVEVFARALPTFQNLLASLRAHDHHIQEYSSGVFPTSKESRDNDVRDVFISSKVVHGVKTGLKERKAERGDCFGTIEELAEFLREQMKIGTGKMSEYPDDTYKDTLVMTYQNEGVCYPLDSPEFAAVQATLDEEWINPISTLFESNDFLLVPSDYGGTLAADLTGRPIGGVRLLILDGCELPIGVSLIAKEKCESDLLMMMQGLEEILGGFVKPKAVMRGYW